MAESFERFMFPLHRYDSGVRAIARPLNWSFCTGSSAARKVRPGMMMGGPNVAAVLASS